MTDISKLTQASRLQDDDLIMVVVGGCPMNIKFKDLLSQLQEVTPPEVKDEYTLTINALPQGARVKIDGVVRNTLTVPARTMVNYIVDAPMHFTKSETIFMDRDVTLNIELLSVINDGFPYMFGEIGVIYAPNPSLITQEKWDAGLYDGGSNNLLTYEISEGQLPDELTSEASGDDYQWWIIMVPTGRVDLSQYRWEAYDELSMDYVEPISGLHQHTGTVTLDGTEWDYSAVRPIVSTKMKFRKI